MKPIIGICCTYIEEETLSGIREGYYNAIEKAGGIPILLPLVSREDTLEGYMDIIDGLLLSGGVDVDPSLFHEQPLRQMGQIDPLRDKNEIYLTRIALEKNLPILGICRGIQILAVATGGKLIQDIPSEAPEAIMHSQKAPKWYGTHEVNILEGTQLSRILQTHTWKTNSYHHQSVKTVGEEFVISATTCDGIIEGIEHKRKKFVLGVQWHPELMWQKDKAHLNIFNAFVNCCNQETKEN